MLKLNDLHDIVKLINLIKIRPGIYDNTQGDHNNRATVEALWKEVADEMNATPVDCKRKWASLRNAFSRDLRNERDAEINKRKKKKWYLATHLWFLRDYLTVKPREEKDTINEQSEYTMDGSTQFFNTSTQDGTFENLYPEEEIEVEEEKIHAFAVQSPPLVYINKRAPSYYNEPEIPYNNEIPHSSKNEQPSPYKIVLPRPTNNEVCENPAKESHAPPSSIAKKIRLTESSEFDERNMIFFKSLIPDILTLSDRRQRLYKQNVLRKLNKFLDEQEAQS
ncbi:transcription factor Adf-1-like [Episyrphus balteatus]|uniref:transcription factor Adf-1-like n=1 Tax=Episyrphus balteatus TaxID=286459 RepID=UPI0024852810|nr:transcription factor Adf-1-like [Episyrphus balteatus]